MSSLFQDFCVYFRSIPEVESEIRAYWNSDEGSPDPRKVYNYLVGKLEASRRLSPERAAFLKEYFAESFNADLVTGYIPKHRDPLITAFAKAYAEVRPLYRVGADVMNLSGLNEAIAAQMGPGHAHDAKRLANQVIRVMTDMLKHKLERVGEVIPIRHGGDELSLYVRPSDPALTQRDVEEVLRLAEREMAVFVRKAGLRHIMHPKNGSKPGSGIGCAVVNLREAYSEVDINQSLEKDIKEAKKHVQTYLGPAIDYRVSEAALKAVPDAYDAVKIDLERLCEVLSHYPQQPTQTKRSSAGVLAALGAGTEDKNFAGHSPDHARLQRALRHFPKAQPGEDAIVAEQLMMNTVSLTHRLDHVTDLPLFTEIDKIMVPNFITEFGRQARVVHFDFNNLGGANNLGSWVGDKVAKLFASCVTDAIELNSDFSPYRFYLSSQGGGKFTLLVPLATDPNAAKEKDKSKRAEMNARAAHAQQHQIEKLTAGIELLLHERSHSKKELKFTPEQEAATREILRKEDAAGFKHRRDHSGDDAKRRHVIGDDERITLAAISNPKSRRLGSHVISLSPPVDLTKARIKDVIDVLEAKAREGQPAIEVFDHQRAVSRTEREAQHASDVAKGNPKKVVDKATLQGTIHHKFVARDIVERP